MTDWSLEVEEAIAMNQRAKPFKIGDRVEISPDFQDPGDADFEWVVVSDEEKGRVDICPSGTGLTVPPRYTVEVSWIKLKAAGPAA